MKILVTGAAGFIGSNLCEYLLNRDHTVIGIDNFNDYYSPKVKEYNIQLFADNPNFILYRTDLLDISELSKVFESEKPAAIVHLAAWAGVTRSLKEPVTYVRNNIEATVNLAELSIKHNIENFIFASTSSIYGDNGTPFIEDMNTDHPLAPYPATKKACEVLLSTYNRNFGLNVTVLRIFNPVGIKIRPDIFLPNVIRSCLYGSECPIYWTEQETKEITARDYTYIGHMLDGILTILETPLGYEILNFGNSEPVYLADFLNTVEEVVGKSINRKYLGNRKGEMLVTYANVDRAKDLINYSPTTTLKESIKIYYDWFVDQEEWYKKGDY